MKRQNIKRTALLAALSVSIIIFGAIVFTPHKHDDTFVEIKPISTPEVVHMELPIPLSSPVVTLRPIPMSETIESPAPSSPAAPSPKQEGECFFTLDILNDTISVAYGVEESTLKKTPGWLTTSVLPGENGMCVVYGHRNRNHLKILEKVTMGDTITATKDGIAYTYTISDVAIYESTSDWRLLTLDGSTLVLVTCYPFRYSGHAPGKYMVTAQLVG